jgi:hypothetical protein
MLKRDTGFKGEQYSLKWTQKSESTYVRNQCLQRYRRHSWDLYRSCSVSVPWTSTQVPVLRLTEVCTPSTITGFTRISGQAFSSRCSNSYMSLIGDEYSTVSKCPHRQNSRWLRSGDRARQLTGPQRPVHSSPKAWFVCCLPIRRIWVTHHARTTCCLSLLNH